MNWENLNEREGMEWESIVQREKKEKSWENLWRMIAFKRENFREFEEIIVGDGNLL